MFATRLFTRAPRSIVARQMSGGKFGFQKSTWETWTSDKGSYPVIVVGVIALGLAASFITYELVKHPDIKITAKNRATTMHSNF